MQRLMKLKLQYEWSILILAHTPKRPLSNPITQNDLAGSKNCSISLIQPLALEKVARELM